MLAKQTNSMVKPKTTKKNSRYGFIQIYYSYLEERREQSKLCLQSLRATRKESEREVPTQVQKKHPEEEVKRYDSSYLKS